MATIRALVVLGLSVNAALASGEFDEISIEDVERQMLAGTLIDYLDRILGDAIHPGPVEMFMTPRGSKDRREVNLELREMADVELSKYQLDRNSRGLALV